MFPFPGYTLSFRFRAKNGDGDGNMVAKHTTQAASFSILMEEEDQ